MEQTTAVASTYTSFIHRLSPLIKGHIVDRHDKYCMVSLTYASAVVINYALAERRLNINVKLTANRKKTKVLFFEARRECGLYGHQPLASST